MEKKILLGSLAQCMLELASLLFLSVCFILLHIYVFNIQSISNVELYLFQGIVFFSWEDGMPFGDQSEYIWSDADWPPNGWAGAESTPIPTCVSPGVGLGSKKGAHLGLGGATIGVGALARRRRNLTGNGAFGVPGYAGIGASGLGWEVQEDFEEFVDPLATVENTSTRAFSSHPSRPFFLAGSSNTHIYLWEVWKYDQEIWMLLLSCPPDKTQVMKKRTQVESL